MHVNFSAQAILYTQNWDDFHNVLNYLPVVRQERSSARFVTAAYAAW